MRANDPRIDKSRGHGGHGLPANLDHAREVEALMRMLHDQRAEARVFAANCLIEMGSLAGLAAVVQAAAAGRFPHCAEMSFVLTTIACEAPDLIRPLVRHRDKEMRLDALEAIVESGRRDFARDLVPLLEDKDPELRAVAAIGLGRLRYGQAKGALRRLLADENWQVKHCAVRALKHLRHGGDGGRLIRRRRLLARLCSN